MRPEEESALTEMKGVEPPLSLNPAFRKNRSTEESVDELWDALMAGDRSALSRSITMVESTTPKHQICADALMERAGKSGANSLRIGISGPPGVGKSSLLERLGLHLVELGHRIAILAIDPTSSLTQGSILGDRSRMQELSSREEVFIRPTPSGEAIGGVAQGTADAILLCEAAGYDLVFVETVGVGQSDGVVAELVDLFVLLALPGAGDELQGIKRGVMELADLVVVTKADGESRHAAEIAVAQLVHALGFLRHGEEIPVNICSAKTGEGIEALWQVCIEILECRRRTGELLTRRAANQIKRFQATLRQEWVRELERNPVLRELIKAAEAEAMNGDVRPRRVVRQLLDKISFCLDPHSQRP